MQSSLSPVKTVAKVILDQLQLWGVTRIYGVVGDAIFGLMDALAKKNAIQFIAVKHESVAAMMASAEAKLTGNLGVCVAQMGPGLGNLINGLGDAYLDHAPVLALTGQAPLDRIGTDYKQYIDQQELVKPFARYSTLVTHPDPILEIMAKAMQISLTEKAVTHLSIPQDLFDMTTSAQPIPKPSILSSTIMKSPQQLIDLLSSARQPMIIVGANERKVAPEIEQLAIRWGAGIVVSLGAKGMIPDHSPQMLGGIGQGGNPYLPQLLKQTDVILLIGKHPEIAKYLPPNIRIIQLEQQPSQLGNGLPIEMGIISDLKMTLSFLYQGLQNYQTNPNWLRQMKEVKQLWDNENEQEGNHTGSPIPPSRIMRALERVIAPNAIIALDYGDGTIWFSRNFRSKNQEILVSEHWRTMGFGLPAALAAKLCAPDRQVIAIVGDGGLAMTLADLLTATRYQLPILVVLLNNGTLQMERDKMQMHGYLQEGVVLTNPNFVRLAEACHWDSYRVEEADQLEETLQKALYSPQPTLVDIYTAPIPHPDLVSQNKS